jgi:hypothetical protein
VKSNQPFIKQLWKSWSGTVTRVRIDCAAKYGEARKLFKACQEIGFPGVSLRVNELKK